MPVVDMPLEELKSYKGKSPRPADFDRYWEEGLEEMRAIDSSVELVPADYELPFAKCYHLYFTGVGGARIHSKLIMPNGITTPAPAILKFHGYCANCGEWFEMIPYASCGMVVASMDCRGQNGESEDIGAVSANTVRGHIIRGICDNAYKLLYRSIFLDTAQLAAIIMNMDEVNSSDVRATGYSQGGALTLACAALEPRISKIARVYPFLSDYKRVWEMDLLTSAAQEIREYFRWYDPLHEREDEFFEKLGYIDVQNLAGYIKANVLFTATLRDDICPPSTQFATYNKIESSKTLNLYYDFGHEGLRDCNDKILRFMMDS